MEAAGEQEKHLENREMLLLMVFAKSSDLLDLVLLPRCCMSCRPTRSGALTSSGAPETLPSCPPLRLTGGSAFTPSWEAAWMG